jgi:hypothetical protein
LSTKVLEEIREELQEIKHLYKELVDKLIPVEEATQKEKKAIEEKDEIADEKELMQTFQANYFWLNLGNISTTDELELLRQWRCHLHLPFFNINKQGMPLWSSNITHLALYEDTSYLCQLLSPMALF